MKAELMEIGTKAKEAAGKMEFSFRACLNL